MRKVLYFHYQRSERDGSFVHTREFEAAFRRLCAPKQIAFDVVAPPLVVPEFWQPGFFARMRSALAKLYLRDVKALLQQWRRSGEELEILRREQPEIVLTRFDDNTLSILWACRKLGIPVVIEVNAPERDELDAAYRQLPIFRRLFSNRHALELADGAFTVSEAISRPLRATANGKPVLTIPNGVDVTRFDPALSPLPVRRRFEIPEGHVTFGFVGSFAPWHGLDMLVDAFSVLIAEGLPVHLLLVGQANAQWQALLDRLRSPALAPHVSLAGFVQPQDIPPYLAAMDVTVLPNAAYYCSPLKLFEYMAMARPTVAANIEPVAAMLEDGREGMLFPVGDVAALTARLRQLVEQPELRRSLGDGARSRMEQEFTWDHNAARVYSLLEQVLLRKSAA
jgi:glycosyltransferase involved in cell wall biosynthesis